MEACLAVEKEHTKVNQKLQSASQTISNKMEETINSLQSLRSSLANEEKPVLTDEEVQSVKSLISQVTSDVQSVSQTHKDMHASISKYGRIIDKYFMQDSKSVSSSITAQQNKASLSRAIYEHLLREGRMDVAETLLKEAGLSHEESFMTLFKDIHYIVQALRNRDVDPALRWVEGHRDELLRHGSSLEFKFKQRKYLLLLSLGQINEALSYAKELGDFSPLHNKEIQRLMGCLLFIRRGLESSPYSDLLDPWHWSDIIDTFTRDACYLLGLSLESPLAVSLAIGSAALPQLLHLQSVMIQRQMADVLSGRDELPCEIQLPWRYRYHSIFTCPILRQQTSESNPPVRLNCGHAISRDAMKKLVGHSGRLKCPYCPLEMMAKDVHILKF